MMILRLAHNFSGRITNEQWILAGDYALDDPRLLLIGKYLLANGHAVIVAEEGDAPEPETVEDDLSDDEVAEGMGDAQTSLGDAQTSLGDEERAETFEFKGRTIVADPPVKPPAPRKDARSPRGRR